MIHYIYIDISNILNIRIIFSVIFKYKAFFMHLHLD